jgi:hypothetical protein
MRRRRTRRRMKTREKLMKWKKPSNSKSIEHGSKDSM